MNREITEKEGAISERQCLGVFNEFLLKEYDNIAQAHFNTKQTLTAFFRYYLLIVALPIPFVALFVEKVINTSSGQATSNELFLNLIGIAPYMSLAIGLLGVFVMLYMANLHFEALLYARQVNGIRWYFYKIAKKNTFTEFEKMAVLPIDKTSPKANGFHSFLFVVFVFIIIDSLYILYAIYHLLASSTQCPGNVIVIFLIVSFLFHIILYIGNAMRYEKKWKRMFDISIL